MLVAIAREVSAAIARCELTHLARTSIDVEEARRQHAAYTRCLEDLGCRVTLLRAEPDLPDSVFVEDAAVVFDEVAVLTRPGAESRRLEVESIADALRPYRELARIEEPATLDGGDVVVVGRRVFVGLTTRTTPEGVAALARIVAPLGYEVRGVRAHGCLHLKSAATAIGDGAIVLNPGWVNGSDFGDVQRIAVDPAEPAAANAVRVGPALVVAEHFPRTAERLEESGRAVHRVPATELAKAEGAVTCCSLVFEVGG